jgi:hypothetical protein
MPAGTDNTRRLTEAQVCEIAGTSQQRRQGWVKRRWLRKAPPGGCGLRDALELTQLKALIDVLGPTDGPVAWLQVVLTWSSRSRLSSSTSCSTSSSSVRLWRGPTPIYAR